MSDFKGKVAVITGGADGFGGETAQLLAKEGAAVFLWDVKEEKGAALAKKITENGGIADFRRVDVRFSQEIKDAVNIIKEKYGKVDILFNSAGVQQIKAGDVVEIDEEEWDKVMDTNLKGTFLTARHIIPLMKETGGAIVNVASTWGVLASNKVPAYCTSKAAVIQLTKSMAIDHAPDNIRVNVIGPGTCRTAMVEGIVSNNYKKFGFATEDEMWDSRKAAHPLGRVGTARDIANLVLFLVSDQSTWMTGSLIMIDGGYTTGKTFAGGKKS